MLCAWALHASASVPAAAMTASDAASIATMPSYGFGVDTTRGLRTLVPKGWKIVLREGVTLPATISWSLGERWTDAVTKFAMANNLAVLLDWRAHLVVISTPGQAMESNALRQEIAEAAKTPLPSLSPSPAVQVASALPQRATSPQVAPQARSGKAFPSSTASTPAVAVNVKAAASRAGLATAMEGAKAPAVAASAAKSESVQVHTTVRVEVAQAAAPSSFLKTGAVASTPSEQGTAPSKPTVLLQGVRVNPTPQMAQASEEAERQSPAQYRSTPTFAYRAATAFSKPSLYEVAGAMAGHFHYRLEYVASAYRLKGPVTLLGVSAQQDGQLLEQAVGNTAPVEVQVDSEEKVVRVFNKNRPMAPAVMDAMYAAQQAASARVEAPHAAPVAPKPVSVQMALAPGESLQEALSDFLAHSGFTLTWKVQGGFEARASTAYSADNVLGVLQRVLPPLGLSADVYPEKHLVIVRPFDPALDK